MRKLLVDAIKARAMFYYAFYKEFSAEIGSEKTAELMKRAIYKRGLEIGKRLAKFAPDDMEGRPRPSKTTRSWERQGPCLLRCAFSAASRPHQPEAEPMISVGLVPRRLPPLGRKAPDTHGTIPTLPPDRVSRSHGARAGSRE